ncbi:MAG: tetratricopeptide repeat protein, partial [Candidatus Tectomicrobia bacterium]
MRPPHRWQHGNLNARGRPQPVPASLLVLIVMVSCALTWSGWLVFPTVALGADKQAALAYAKGIVEFSNRNYLDALDHFRSAAELEPDNPDARFYLGLTLSRLGEYAEAISALEMSLQLDASRDYVHYPLGLAYFLVQRYSEALGQFKLAEQFDPQKAATQFYLGNTYHLLKQHRKALPPLQRAVALDASLAQASQYQQGLALFALERDAAARQAFEAVVEAAPESQVADNARRYLGVIEDRASQRRLFQVQGAIGFQFDDNVVLGNDLEISRESDGRTVLSVQATLLPIHTLWHLGAQYKLFQSLHFKLDDFDIRSHTAEVFTRYKLDRLTLRLTANYTYALLHNERFSEDVFIQSTATIKQTKTLFGVASLGYRLNNFFDDIPATQDPEVRDRDGWNIRSGYTQFLSLYKGRAVVSLSYHFTVERNEGTDWEYDAHDIGLGLQASLFGDVFLDLAGSYSRRDYLHANSFAAAPLSRLDPGDSKERFDERWVASVTLARPLATYFLLSANYTHTSNVSNIGFFDY